MNKVWKIVGSLAAVLLVLGVICVGVAFITGTDVQRVTDLFNAKYEFDFTGYYNNIAETVNRILGMQLL